MRLPTRRARARCVDWERRFAWDRFPPEVAPETQSSSPIQPVLSPDGAGGPRNVDSSFRSEPPPARALLSRMHPLAHPVHRLSPQPVDTLASDIVLDPPCSFASHSRPLGLRNLQVTSPIARRLSEGPSEREFGDVVCQNAVDHVQLSRSHCFLRLHEFHVVGYAGLKFLTNQLEVLFRYLKIVVSDAQLRS